MQFQSYYYLFLFLPIVFFVYNFLNKNTLKNIFLILSSYFFYSWGNPLLVLLLISSSVVDYFIGKKLRGLNNEIESSKNHLEIKKLDISKKLFLIISIFFNVGLLFFFKYWDWSIGQISGLLQSINEPALSAQVLGFRHYINVPPGISFYTFQTLSYSIDNYRRQFNRDVSFIDYLAFVAFFPQLIAGPIERANNLLTQLSFKRRKVPFKIVERCIFVIFYGVCKKLVFADNFGFLVDRCYENIKIPGVGITLLIAFSFQIYCDFSAYSDIARGSARLFGIKLKRNFLTPYLSINPSDFWRRWHISLSQWVRDYIYIPLGGNRCSLQRNIFNLLFTMAIMGAWHGAGKFFILWGIFHGFLLIIYKFIPIDQILITNLGEKLGKPFSIVIMYIFILFGWLLFYSRNDLIVFSNIFNNFINSTSIIFSSYQNKIEFFQLNYGLLIFLIPVCLTELIAYKYNLEFIDIVKNSNYYVKLSIYLFIFYSILIFGSRGTYDFIYFQF